MTISMNARRKTSRNTGIALLVVLIIVMAITITALGFLSQSDVELACGQNMLMRTQMDYLAESGLEHARGLILNPQDVPAEYWAGGTGLQLVSGSNDRYNVTVNRDAADRCNYTIDCDSYRMKDTERIGLSRLHAVLRLDPCIAYWVDGDTTIPSQVAITGDVYCGGNLTNNGVINGDVFAVGTIGGTNPQGQKKPAAEADVDWPGLVVSTPYYLGSTPYSADVPADANALTGAYGSSPTNPKGIWYCIGNANITSDATINGTLVVNGNLMVSGTNNIITASKNFPALLVGGQVLMGNGSRLTINGLAQVGGPMTFDPNATSATVQITGGLFINSGGIEGGPLNTPVVIIAAPSIASIEIWPAADTSKRWRPMAGAFFKSIERVK